ncbi:MAG: glycoside hydrolase family 113 [Cytophagales bacterium]
MKLMLLAILLLSIGQPSVAQKTYPEKINGANFVSPKYKNKLDGIDSLMSINANWIALCPFAIMENNNSIITYNSTKNWWGDTKIGLIEEIKRARANKLKVMIKPHFWVINKGWVGDFDLSGKKKIEWENNYKDYLLFLADLSDSLDIEMLCIGTELKTYTKNHPQFFIELIGETRKLYKGKLTYAANWDEYKYVNFWDKLDYISIDAYFPLSDKKTPEITELELEWKNITVDLKNFSFKLDKKIIFTEYGYRSINCAANKQWEFEKTPKTEQINFMAQTNAYAAFYNTVWKEQCIAGGFLWKWYNEYNLDKNNSDYTPQQKPVLQLIKTHYAKKL